MHFVLHAHLQSFERSYVFRIAKWTQTHAESVCVTLLASGFGGPEVTPVTGRGEASGALALGETAHSMVAELDLLRRELAETVDITDLDALAGWIAALRPSGVRNALDCAMWDLRAKSGAQSAAQLAGCAPLTAVETSYTLGIGSLEELHAKVAMAKDHRILKVKVNAVQTVDTVAAAHALRPDAEIYVDANESWTFEQLCAWAPRLRELGVTLIEQPLPALADAALAGYYCPLALIADESTNRVAASDIRERQGEQPGTEGSILHLFPGLYPFLKRDLVKHRESARALKPAPLLGISAFSGCSGIFWNRQLACPAGLEPATPSLEGWCSIQLSYGQRVAAF